ncbi:MAG: LytTR family DNA-binding domain-containing protein [Bacteroidia bacterium]|nr:LytTR family DNA-binding domain-containing protein [Bacteroidia bacterium]
MRILIIEDEDLVAQNLVRQLKELLPDASLIGPFASKRETSAWMETNPAPDLILSDIQLSDGLSLDLFSQGKLGSPIIFTTAYNEFALRAFKINSVDYLLKPIDKDELAKALDKFYQLKSKYANSSFLEETSAFFKNFKQETANFKKRFAVHQGKSMVLVPTEDVVYFSKEELIFLHNKQGESFVTDYRSLDEIEELLNPELFFRCNRQNLIHLAYVNSFKPDFTGKLEVKMKTGHAPEFQVSKEKAHDFRKWFEG